MFALRRAANPLRISVFRLGAARTCYTKSDILREDSQHVVSSCFHTRCVCGKCILQSKRFHQSQSFHEKRFTSRGLSSQTGAKSSGEDEDLEDGFSELETPVSDVGEETNVAEENVEEQISDLELSDNDAEEELVEDSPNEIEFSGIDSGNVGEDSPKRRIPSELFKVILAASPQNVNGALEKFVEEGNSLGRTEISLAMLNLRKRRMYGKALQLSKWLEENKRLNFAERDYASRLDLIAKVRGLVMAEKYIGTIPESFRGEVIYRTLLANCVIADNLKKAEAVFNKMKDLQFPITAFACNQLILLYKRQDKKKIADVLLLMEKENVKPTLFTYKLLIDTKGQSNDITGMEQLLETMKSEGFEPDMHIQSTLARHYIYGGFNEKAEEILKEMEGGNLKEHGGACRALLPLYAALGKADEVGRIWKACESNPRIDECLAAIEAWGKVGKVEKAEEVFEKMVKTGKKLSSKCYTSLLNVYAKHKQLAKGKDLAKRMATDGYRIDPFTWDALVKLYAEAGEVEKADSILQKAVQQENRMKPLFSSYMTIMDQYARRGDVHNAEKMFLRLRQAGYVGRLRQYQSLLQAYINAKAPAYGFRERMKADNIFPNKTVAAQLAQVDAFRKTAISDLLD
ncbi:Pentatricopeptide repeat [Macleaya cordata]|uniref:Pentatricopeptide repeat n=1 Tax=Macleaya cordata TaxID=56857 RepID=A0A200Q965_MACCD|nr:Pentatricopeptide repeat [Macleaya cordata]